MAHIWQVAVWMMAWMGGYVSFMVYVILVCSEIGIATGYKLRNYILVCGSSGRQGIQYVCGCLCGSSERLGAVYKVRY